MPKLKPSEDELKNRKARACISKYIELNNLSEEEIAIKIHVVKRTFQNKRKRPETFTLKELRRLCLVLRIPDEEKVQLL